MSDTESDDDFQSADEGEESSVECFPTEPYHFSDNQYKDVIKNKSSTNSATRTSTNTTSEYQQEHLENFHQITKMIQETELTETDGDSKMSEHEHEDKIRESFDDYSNKHTKELQSSNDEKKIHDDIIQLGHTSSIVLEEDDTNVRSQEITNICCHRESEFLQDSKVETDNGEGSNKDKKMTNDLDKVEMLDTSCYFENALENKNKDIIQTPVKESLEKPDMKNVNSLIQSTELENECAEINTEKVTLNSINIDEVNMKDKEKECPVQKKETATKTKSVEQINEQDLLKEKITSDENVVPKKVESQEQDKEDWGWDSWADDFIMQTGAKVSSLLETVEGHLGIPDPIEMAKISKIQEQKVFSETANKEQNKQLKNESIVQSPSGASSWFSSFIPVSTITSLVQSTGTDLVSGSIDALEFIGKRTVDILSDGDPGLRSKRSALQSGNKPNLSELLKEARTKDENVSSNRTNTKHNPQKFNDMFEKFQGVPNLDALEMISNECQNKLERILNVQSSAARDDSTKILTNISENFELNENKYNLCHEEGDFKKALFSLTKKLQLKVTCSKMLNTWSKLKEKSSNITGSDVNECYETSISSLAEITSRCIEYYRKVADILMLTDMQAKEMSKDRAIALHKITELFQTEVSSITNVYANYFVEQKDEKASSLVTDIYLEGTNCTTVLEDAHALLLPILQLSAIK